MSGKSCASSFSSKVLSVFFEKSQEQIDREIERRQRLSESMDRVSQGFKSPKAMALSLHEQMLDGAKIGKIAKMAGVKADLALVASILPAQELGEMACEVACHSGQLAAFHSELGDINQSHGLGDDDVWVKGQAPSKYQEICDLSDQLLECIFQTVFLRVLEMYRLDWIADLFENHRAKFEMRYEVGCRLLNSNINPHTRCKASQ